MAGDRAEGGLLTVGVGIEQLATTSDNEWEALFLSSDKEGVETGTSSLVVESLVSGAGFGGG